MQRFRKHLRIGWRWLLSGWQLFQRNPWSLGGMGFSTAVLISVLSLIPLVGALLIALVAPVLLASAYLFIDGLYKQKMALPASLRVTALKQSPRRLLEVFRDEARWLPTAVAGIYSIAVVLLINLLVRLVAGEAWVANWSNLNLLGLLGVLVVALFAFVPYVLLGASLIYALPLAFLRDEPLVPSLWRSLKAGRHFTFALMVLLGWLLTPYLLGALAALISPWATYLIWIVTGTLVLPVGTAALYISYRNIFAVKEANTGIDTHAHTGSAIESQ